MMTESLDNIVIDNINIEIKSILHINSTLEPIIFLHEGLGSISLWKDFPDKIAKITKRDVIIYSRLGMGNSSSLKEPRNVYYMHQEAKNYLPKILKYLKITNPILFGHSDGASIALIYAGNKNNVKFGTLIWNFLIPLSKILDILLNNSVGKSLLCVYKK